MTILSPTAEELSVTIDEFLMLVFETLEYHRRDAVRAVLQETIDALRRIHRRARLANHRYVQNS